MKLVEFMEANKRAGMPQSMQDLLIEQTSIWTNNACLGYALMAMEDAGYDEAEIRKFIRLIKDAMEFTGVEEAEEHYNHSPY